MKTHIDKYTNTDLSIQIQNTNTDRNAFTNTEDTRRSKLGISAKTVAETFDLVLCFYSCFGLSFVCFYQCLQKCAGAAAVSVQGASDLQSLRLRGGSKWLYLHLYLYLYLHLYPLAKISSSS